jgi:hypothetical protein
VTSRTGASSGTCNSPHQLPYRDDRASKEALRHRHRGRVPLEASLDGDATVPRVNVDHSDVAQYRAALACCFGAEGPKVCIVGLERFEEFVARLG